MPATDERTLSIEEEHLIQEAREKAEVLYRGQLVRHHSCGASLAVTFNLSAKPYQALRKGGITGERFCGAIRAGELILGEILGDESPTGGVTDELRSAMFWYQKQIPARFKTPASATGYACNDITRPLGEFMGATRKDFCTRLAGEVAALTAEAIVRFAPAGTIMITPVTPSED